ncbi:MAG: hypothetical protein KDA73_12585 [Rhodobacteraceae bacterium]|nr:hypothetical protein [Paracoccaceae bacterium]
MIATLHQAMQLNPDDPAILGTAGNCMAYSGDWEDGVSLARCGIALAQEND